MKALRKISATMDIFNITDINSVIRNKKNQICIDIFRALKECHYDVSEYEQEMQKYEFFSEKYKNLYNRRNLQTVFYNYYLPLTNKFPDMSNCTLDEIKEFITEERFPISKFLLAVLTISGAPEEVINHITFRDVFLSNIDEIRSNLKKYKGSAFGAGPRAKLNISNAELTKIVKELPCECSEIPNLSYEEGKSFVSNSYRANLFCTRKVDLLAAYDWPHLDKLQKDNEILTQKLNIINSLNLGRMSSIQALILLEKTLQCDMLQLHELPLNVFEERLNNARRAKLLYTILVHHLGQDYMDQLDLLDSVVGVTMKDKFKEMADEWTIKLFEDIMRFFEVDSEPNTSILEVNIKKIEYNTLVIFMDLIKYVANNYDTLRAKGARNYVPNTMQSFFHSATIDMLTNYMINHGRNLNVQNHKVKNQIDTHHAKRRLFQILRIFKSEPLKNILQIDPTTIKISAILNKIENKRELNDERQPYTDEEIDAIFEACQNDPKWTLIITILREIGLRVGAICNLKVSDVIDKFLLPKHEGQAVEKGNKIRKFIIGPNMKRKIVSYISAYRPLIDSAQNEGVDLNEMYLFGLEKQSRPSVNYIEQHLKIIARDAGLTTRVYPHLFRHTLVKVLEDSGNTMNEISKFMGHSNVDTTQKWYSIRTITDIVENMKNPFYDIQVSPQEQEEEYQDDLDRAHTKLETCVSVISGIMSMVCDEDRKKIYERMPNIDKVMRVIVDSCAGSTELRSAGTEGATTSYSLSSKRPKSFNAQSVNEDYIGDFI
ncbi:MAG: tyrosine-type recombinase/integrase [Cetobacterium sp.]